MVHNPGPAAPGYRPLAGEAPAPSATLRIGACRIGNHRRKQIAAMALPGSVRVGLSDPPNGSGSPLSAGHAGRPATTRPDGPGGTSFLAAPVALRGTSSIFVAGNGSLATAEAVANRRGQFFRPTPTRYGTPPGQLPGIGSALRSLRPRANPGASAIIGRNGFLTCPRRASVPDTIAPQLAQASYPSTRRTRRGLSLRTRHQPQKRLGVWSRRVGPTAGCSAGPVVRAEFYRTSIQPAATMPPGMTAIRHQSGKAYEQKPIFPWPRRDPSSLPYGSALPSAFRGSPLPVGRRRTRRGTFFPVITKPSPCVAAPVARASSLSHRTRATRRGHLFDNAR